MKPWLVIGHGGQLARAFRTLLPDAVFLSRAQADLALPESLMQTLETYDPRAIINAAAYTQVDKAEKEEALAHAVNAQSPGVMAAYCKARQIPLVHFSTDYVFDGSGETPWREGDAPAPLNAYGRSKLAGEAAITESGCRHLIFRTSWLYDAQGKNFLNTIVRLAAEKDELRIIDDQYGAPTYAPDLAAGVLSMLKHALQNPRFPTGIYHLCSQGATTWHGFACAIVERARMRGLPLKVQAVHPIPAGEYPLPALRPRNSRLDCARALSMFGVALPSWQEGLARCMEIKA